MRSMITHAAVAAAVALSGVACDSEVEERAEERVDEQTEANGYETLDEEIQEIGAGEVAEFEREQAQGDHPIADEFREEVAEEDDTETEAVLESEGKR